MRIEILSDEIDIDENAFGGSRVIIVRESGSPAHDFALEHTVDFELK